MLKEMEHNPTPSQVRTFGLTVLGGFFVLGGLLWLRGRAAGSGWGWSGSGRQIAALALWGGGAVVALASWLSPPLGRRLRAGWMRAGALLGAVSSTVVLTLLFALLLPPFALLRLKDPLRLKRRAGGSYWEKYPMDEPTLARMSRMF